MRVAVCRKTVPPGPGGYWMRIISNDDGRRLCVGFVSQAAADSIASQFFVLGWVGGDTIDPFNILDRSCICPSALSTYLYVRPISRTFLRLCVRRLCVRHTILDRSCICPYALSVRSPDSVARYLSVTADACRPIYLRRHPVREVIVDDSRLRVLYRTIAYRIQHCSYSYCLEKAVSTKRVRILLNMMSAVLVPYSTVLVPCISQSVQYSTVSYFGKSPHDSTVRLRFATLCNSTVSA